MGSFASSTLPQADAGVPGSLIGRRLLRADSLRVGSGRVRPGQPFAGTVTRIR